MNIKETLNKSKAVVRYISRSLRVPREARCIEGCERETLTTNGLIQRFLNHTKLIYGAMLLASVFLTACGGGGGGGGGTTTTSTTYTIGGTVSGLTTGTVVLQNNGGNNLSISANGSFTFTTALANGTAYSVTVLTQPTGQVCTASSNTGTVSGANVTSVSVTCASSTHTIGGTISGLTGTVVLQNNGGDNLSINANGSFTFATPVAHSAAYAVTVLTQPTNQRCTVTYGTGIAIANVTGITVSCVAVYPVSVRVSGLGTSRGLKFQNSVFGLFDDNLSITTNGTFAFTQNLAAGDSYSVKVFIQPAAPALICKPTGAGTPYSPFSGTMPASAITVDFLCAAPVPVHAYVANSGSNNISAFTIATGALVAVAGSPFATGGSNPQSVAVDPSGKFIYAANSLTNDISAFTITAGTGALTQVICAGGPTSCNGAGTPTARYKVGTNPHAVTVDPSGRFIYVVNMDLASNDISAYTINPNTGALTPIDANAGTAGIQNFAAGNAPSAISIDHNGQFAYVTNANDGTVSAYTINATTGALTRVSCGGVAGCDVVTGTDFLAGAGPQSVDIDPTSSFVYVANAAGNSVSAYTINPTTGALVPVTGSPFAAGFAPTSVAVDPTGTHVYVANKDVASNNVSAYTINATTGALAPVAGSPFAAGTAPTSVAVDLNGVYVYVANFGGGISAYSSSVGVLTPLGGSPFAAGTAPASVVTAVVY